MGSQPLPPADIAMNIDLTVSPVSAQLYDRGYQYHPSLETIHVLSGCVILAVMSGTPERGLSAKLLKVEVTPTAKIEPEASA